MLLNYNENVIRILRYQSEDGESPISTWFGDLRDSRARAQIEIRLRRVSTGNFGDCNPVGEGVLELKIDVGAGYRVYCARHGQALIILLCGGNKSTQKTDIKLAKDYWLDWKRRNK
ncbi:type II toxin-antitoxin system RelE/ParE family toxin [Ferrovum sp.]|uniref:type II toxin-antitoxin system RelE/ParE family toxin n=1 Tax=Ferrovum sp. TaxID=2609467 RepID=UPI002628BDB6|nr:type II toxin-antitoxin system RelE/ParE family toxin [Ferrovum sp.]